MDAKGIGYGCARDWQVIAMDRLWMRKGQAMDAQGIGYGQAMDAKGIAMDRLWMRKGQAMDRQGIATDRLWMRKGCSMQIHRLTDSQIHKFTYSHKNMCSAFRHNIYNMIVVI